MDLNGIKKKKKFPLAAVLVLLSVLAFLFISMPASLEKVMYENWICDTVCLVLSLGLFFFLLFMEKVDLFSPVTFCSAIYITMFFVTPLYDIYCGETERFGVKDLFDYGVLGSVIAFIGYSSFCLFFMVRSGRHMEYKPVFNSTLPEQSKRSIAIVSLVMWILVFLLGLALTIVSNGFSVMYILTFGILGNGEQIDSSLSSVGFIMQFTRCIVPIYVIFCSVSRKKALKVILFLMTLGLETIRGFRYMLVILVCSLFYYFYISRNKKVNHIRLAVVLAVLLVLIGVIEFGRSSVRSGAGLDLSGFTVDAVIRALVGNFRIYSAYYGVLKVVPSTLPYMYFDQIIVYTVILVVPRAVWPAKPEPPGRAAIEIGMNSQALASGYAYPCIGEYYYSFGIGGVVVIMGMIGWWLASVENKFRLKAKNELDLSLYCVLVPTMLQLLIRGYTPTNFYLVVAMFFPYWVLNTCLKRLGKKEKLLKTPRKERE